MKKIQREDIQIIGRHSNLTEKGVVKALKENVYNDKKAWQKFFQLLFISLGVGFTVSGIVFFFAYNWTDLHKFAKIGMVEGLVIVATIFALRPKMNNNIRNIILTGTSVLVGVLFAVYGQIYQTGANAYDFFLAWTISVTLWVAVSNFPPLYLLYLVLMNTTFILYSQQVAKWPGFFVLTSLFIFNSIVLIFAIVLSKYRKAGNIPNWFLNIVALSCIVSATIGIIIGIFAPSETYFSALIVAAIITFTLGIWYGIKTKSGFYLSAIPFSLIAIVSALLFKASFDLGMFLFVSIFVVTGVTFIIKTLIKFQKKGENEQ